MDRIVFLVEDDPDVLSSMKFLLETEGFRVEAFATGSDFLSTASFGLGNCLIIDFKMPGIDGLQTVRHLRDRQISIPVVLVTAYERLAAMAASYGIEHVVLKPDTAECLVPYVNAAIEGGLRPPPGKPLGARP